MTSLDVRIYGQPFDYWLKKNKYYHSLMRKFYQFTVPAGSRVLHIGCKNGYLLKYLKPSYALGIEQDEQELHFAKSKHPQYVFKQSLPEVHETFDYIIVSSYVMELDDIQAFFESLKRISTPDTRLVIDWHSALWEPVLKILQKCGLRRPTQFKNWISPADMRNFLYLSGFEVVTAGRQILCPGYIPLVSWFCNSLGALIPGINSLCVNNWLIARMQPVKKNDVKVSVIIPCRNERGNVESAVQRCPAMGLGTEIIFVEGHSKDDTLSEIKRVIAAYPDKDIKMFVQQGKGKGDAVRLGFEHAQGDLFMILDADLTMPAEELPKFYQAYITGKGEFINGSRLVYGMESQAMQFLNLIANYCFGIGFSWTLGQKVKDTLCGTKVLHRKAYNAIVRNRAFFGDFDPFGDFDLLFGAAKQNLKIIDMPIRYKNRVYGSTQISRFYHGLLLLRMSFIAFCKFKLRI